MFPSETQIEWIYGDMYIIIMDRFTNCGKEPCNCNFIY